MNRTIEEVKKTCKLTIQSMKVRLGDIKSGIGTAKLEGLDSSILELEGIKLIAKIHGYEAAVDQIFADLGV